MGLFTRVETKLSQLIIIGNLHMTCNMLMTTILEKGDFAIVYIDDMMLSDRHMNPMLTFHYDLCLHVSPSTAA